MWTPQLQAESETKPLFRQVVTMAEGDGDNISQPGTAQSAAVLNDDSQQKTPTLISLPDTTLPYFYDTDDKKMPPTESRGRSKIR